MKSRILRNYQNLLCQVFDFYSSSITNPEYFEEIRHTCKEQAILKLIHNHDINIDMKYLTKDDFLIFLSVKGLVGNGIETAIFDYILEILVENLILIKFDPNTLNNTHVMFRCNEPVANFYHENGLLLNKLFGFDYIVTKYIKSVYKIENISKSESGIGNGFLLKIINDFYIVTNKHVLDKADQINVFNSQDEIIEIESKIIDENEDLAFLKIKDKNLDSIPFLLNPNLQILDDIITIGYPPVPTSKAAFPLIHKGEVNSFIEDYWGNSLFVFSAKTNPGNSGSPIIDKDGCVIGIVTQQLEDQEWYKLSKIPYYAGIPAKTIIEILEKSEKKFNI